MSQIISSTQSTDLLDVLHQRFDQNPIRHPQLDWSHVSQKLSTSVAKLKSLFEMERTGGEPDVIGVDRKTGEYLFVDCSAESPSGRRSLCYDRIALDARKVAKPKGNAIDFASDMGVHILDEQTYRHLQTLGQFDLKTSSWILTPSSIRSLGGAIFADRRYNTVFVYHNGADSYYAARGFRCLLRV